MLIAYYVFFLKALNAFVFLLTYQNYVLRLKDVLFLSTLKMICAIVHTVLQFIETLGSFFELLFLNHTKVLHIV